jgi:YHS domain-containing protein
MIYIVLFYLGYQAIRRWLLGPGGGHAPKNRREIDDIMVKDPQCGVFFPKKEAVHLRRGDEDLFFCSQKCRDDYEKNHP